MKKLVFFLLFVPFWSKGQDTVRITHERYTTTYSISKHYPVVVHWTVLPADICGPDNDRRVNRTSNFSRDPKLPAYTNLQQYYSNNSGGYQRGHNMDAADNSCNRQQMKECFYFSNMTPQTSELNEQRWGDLEDYTRNLVRQYGKVDVWCGSYGNSNNRTMGPVSVPNYCWKILHYNGKAEYYIFPNTHDVTDFPFQHYQRDIASIRQGSGLALPGL